MAFEETLLDVLDNNQEPLSKRMKLADNVFKMSHIRMQYKEVFLLKWLIKYLDDGGNSCADICDLIVKWLESEVVKELSRNDVKIDDFLDFITSFLERIRSYSATKSFDKKFINIIYLITENKIFREYFKYNLKIYMELLTVAVQEISCSSDFTEFLKKQWIINRSLVTEEKFHKYFLDTLAPALTVKLLNYDDNVQIFEEVSKIFQKSVFQSNIRNFESYLSQYFEEQTVEKEHSIVPKAVMKYLISSYSSSKPSISYKLVLHAFCGAYNSPILRYKFLIVIMQTIGFELTPNFDLKKATKLKTTVDFSKSIEIYLELLDVLNGSNFIDAELEKVTLTDFLRNVLKSIMSFDVHSDTVYRIFSKSIIINPLVIEPIAGQVVGFLTSVNNENRMESYENLMISIFQVFAKLHRTEKFVAKMIQSLGKCLIEGENSFDKVYGFSGVVNAEENVKVDLIASNIFSENILQCFTRCIYDLASWQVVNLLKTLCYHLKAGVEEIFTKQDGKQGIGKYLFLELVGILTCRLLQSNKMADHTVPLNLVKKFVTGLEELKEIFKTLGQSMLLREHNNDTMRTFLNMCYVWGEVYMTLNYYSEDGEIEMVRVIDNTFTACNLMYVHSYLDVSEWQLISQRITNFGEYECKKLLQKLFLQKIRAMLLFEGNVNEQVSANVIKMIENHMEETWQDLLSDKFTVKFILPKMENKSRIFLAESLTNNDLLSKEPHVLDSVHLLNAVHFFIMSKISKLLRRKRKHQENQTKALSSTFFSLIPESVFLNDAVVEFKDIVEDIQEKLGSCQGTTLNLAEETVYELLTVLKKFPIIYGPVLCQKIELLYLFCLHNDIAGCSQNLKSICESLIIGILQSCKFQLTDFNIAQLCTWIINNFERYESVFLLILTSVFKDEESITKFVPFIDYVTQNLQDPKFTKAGLLVLIALNKVKNSKIKLEKKNELKEPLYNRLVVQLMTESDLSVETYAVCLKHYLSSDSESKNARKLLEKLNLYVDHVFENSTTEQNIKGCLALFNTILNNKHKIPNLRDDFILKVWSLVKDLDVSDENIDMYTQLVKLIVTLIPNEEFNCILKDLQNFPSHIDATLTKRLRTWESILACNINPVKMKIWQEAVENLVQWLILTVKSVEITQSLIESIVRAMENVVQTHHFVLSSNLIDMLIILVSVLMKHHSRSEGVCSMCIAILEKLLKFRHALVMDRLPAFLQQYRIVLKHICEKSDSELHLNPSDVNKMADLAHKFEKLTTSLVSFKKDMGRISLYLIADILERYEEISLYSSVKLHLNNCIYGLISLCDNHAVSYLMRALSDASTEMFKVMYEHYKKYYMFTGKV